MGKLHDLSGPLKKALPLPVWGFLRSAGTAVLTPIRFSYQTGHWRSSFNNKAVDPAGEPLPWYTYPAIDFISRRSFATKRVLEFGSGQSTLWWAARAQSVTSFEGDPNWFKQVTTFAPSNATVNLVPEDNAEVCVSAVLATLKERQRGPFDVVIVDGLWRTELVKVAFDNLTETGVVICDNSEGYSFAEAGRERAKNRVDFYGYAPGGVMETCTSIFFGAQSFLTETSYDISLPRGR